MKERPILFNGEMVKAILEGRKTQTRRIVKPQPIKMPNGNFSWKGRTGSFENFGIDQLLDFPENGAVGDRLWVRETFWRDQRDSTLVVMDADSKAQTTNGEYKFVIDEGTDVERLKKNKFWKKYPSIHMPRWASRITLEITGIRVERLNDISKEDANAEGMDLVRDEWSTACGDFDETLTDLQLFKFLWDDIYGNWDQNPYVWVIEFKRVPPSEHGVNCLIDCVGGME